MNARFDRQTWQRLIQLIVPIFRSEARWQMFGFIFALGIFATSVIGVNYVINFQWGKIIDALFTFQEQDRFLIELLKYVAAIGCAAPVVVFQRYTEERFVLRWRKWLSLYFLKAYLSGHAYYSLHAVKGVDNPDQRLEEDIRSFTTQLISFSLILFNSLVAFGAFIALLHSFDRMLPVAAVVYALFGSLVAYFLGRPLISLNNTQLTREANYRYKLINLRENAEPIAFYGTEKKEFTRSRQKLKEALFNLLKIIKRNRDLSLFVTVYNFLIILVPTVIVAPKCLRGEMTVGDLGRVHDAFRQVLGALTLLVTHFSGLSAFAAVVSRLGIFSEAIDEVSKPASGDNIHSTEGESLELRSLTVFTPHRDQRLLEEVSVAINHGGLLITGPSGFGKSSILRTLAGIWASGDGTIIRPPRSKSVYLPQRGYAVSGTLRSQLQYNLGNSVRTTEELLEMVHFVGLTESVRRAGGIDIERDWGRLLSTGELQRLAWARLFLKQPEYVFLDEATTALDVATERHMYEALCRRTKLWVSVGLRQTLFEFHGTVLELTGDGKWRLVCPT